MKKHKLLIAALSLLTFADCFASDGVVATYNNNKVNKSDIQNHYKDVFKSQPAFQNKSFDDLDKAVRENLVKGYVVSKLLVDKAIKLGINSTPEFKAKIEALSTNMMQQELIEKKIKENVTEAKIDEEYKNYIQAIKGQDEVKASHILVKTEEKAKEIKAKLAKGARFANLAKEYSQDESSKANGGALGYFLKGQVLPAIEKKAFSMKVGDVSDIIKTDFGYHIIKVEDKRKAKAHTKEEAKSAITAKLNKIAMEAYLEELIKEADTKLFIE